MQREKKVPAIVLVQTKAPDHFLFSLEGPLTQFQDFDTCERTGWPAAAIAVGLENLSSKSCWHPRKGPFLQCRLDGQHYGPAANVLPGPNWQLGLQMCVVGFYHKYIQCQCD